MEEEESPYEIDMDAPIAVEFKRRKKLKTKKPANAKKNFAANDGGEGGFLAPNENALIEYEFPPGITISLFDYSVENHFRTMDTISKLCGETDTENFDSAEIRRYSSSITFLREWRQFSYPSRSLRFACQNESKDGKEFMGAVSLPQFSSATVPKKDIQNGEGSSSKSSKDFVMYVGGPVWALDWCPRVHSDSDSDVRSEFIAVAAHPPESSYHNIGAPLVGRGVVQIWCVLSSKMKKDMPSQVQKKRKKTSMNSEKSSEQRRPRGRPRKKPVNESSNNINSYKQKGQTPAVHQCLEDSSRLLSVDVANSSDHEIVKVKSTKQRKPRGRTRKQPLDKSQTVQTPAVEYPKYSSMLLSLDVVSEQQRLQGRPRKKLVNESSNNINSYNQKVQTPAVHQCLEDSSRLLSVDVATSSDHEIVKVKSTKQRKPRDKPRKQPLNKSQTVQTPAVEYHKYSSTLLSVDVVSGNTCCHGSQDSGLVQEVSNRKSADESMSVSSKHRRLEDKASTRDQVAENAVPMAILDEKTESSVLNSPILANIEADVMKGDSASAKCCIPEDVALPKMVLCLAHNGKVAWDVKWRPSNVCNKERMGYLAVLLGNGALEVWDVPFPRTVKVVYSASQKDCTDPRFIKLEPIFRCSTIKCGDRQSIPLTLEWSASSPHDLIVAGCHDGVVALWKFSGTGTLEDTRPLLCFSADTVPIRALSWAPVESYSESANVIVTAGHRGMKFWDLRDPFRPLWDFYPAQRIIYSLDWLPDPRCIVVSLDDGTLRILSLLKAAYDVPVTGKPFAGTQQQGCHCYYCSPLPIWSIHTSQLTGMVAYCGADGTALRFQLTTKEVEKDPRRNRASHFLCGSLTDENSTLTMFTPLANTPFPMRKSPDEYDEAPRSIRRFICLSNQQKRAKEKMSKVQTPDEQPAGYGTDLEKEFGTDDTMVVLYSEQATKTKTSSKKKLKANRQPLICGGDNPEIMQLEGGEKADIEEVEVFPPKIVAMHRVRWNINEGSENLLCYGGAAGILRCQEIDMCGL